MGKPGFPIPLRGGGVGKPGFPTPLAEGVCSHQPSMRLAPHPDGMNILPGRVTPSQTLPPGGAMGKPGFPIPLPEGYALPNPPTGWGDGKTRFAHSPA